MVLMKMIVVVTILVLTYFSISCGESQILQIPLKHSYIRSLGAEVENDIDFKSKYTLPSDPNYNLHGMLGQGYFIELAIGQPEQQVKNYIHIFFNIAERLLPDVM